MGSRLPLQLLAAAIFMLSADAQVMIVTQPSGQPDITIGQNATFSVTTNNTGDPLTYQWQKDGTNIMDTTDTYSGTTTANLTVLSVELANEGFYSCVVNGTVNSTSAQLTVVAECGTLSDPTNGNVSTSSGTNEGATATYSCDTGYNFNGSMTRTCGDDGNWTLSEPTCDLVDCGTPPVVTNGSPGAPAMTTFGGMVTYNCTNGYTLTGSATVSCLASGSWSTRPNCTVVDCGSPPNITNGSPGTPDMTTFGGNVTYNCDNGYDLSGTATVSCLSSGSWSTRPNCTAIDCRSPPTIANGSPGTPDMTTFGGTVTYNCTNGYVSMGMSMTTVSCLNTGMWGTVTCTAVDCGNLSITNGQVNTSSGTTFNNMATYSCGAGYTLNGSMTRTCGADGMWTLSEPTCDPVDCGSPPNITNGAPGTPDKTTFGGNVTYTCTSGYETPSGMSMTTVSCLASGVWDTTNCTAVDCGSLPDPTNGEVDTTPGTTFNNTATYSCDTGYNLNGSMTRTCGADRIWTPNEPTCDPVDCGTLADPTNGQVDTSEGTTLNNTATYSCDPGYVLDGGSTQFCDDEGQWMGSLPTCEVDDPMFTTQPTDAPFLLSGGDASFTVIVIGVNVSYEWIFNGVPLSDAPGRISGSDTATLTIMNVTESDVGDYSCNVSNIVGTVPSDIASLTFLSFPTITNGPMDVSVQPGESVQFSCTASSEDGSVTFAWSTTAPNMTLPIAVGVFDNTSMIQLDNANVSRRGDYICTATNARGSVAANATLYVIVVPPILNQTVPTGNDVSFTCVAQGGPPNIEYAWHQVVGDIFIVADTDPLSTDGRFLYGDRVSGENTAVLTIRNVGVEDAGSYACNVTVEGSLVDTAIAVLTTVGPMIVQGLPDPFINLNANSTLNLSCLGQNPDNADSPLFFRWAIGSKTIDENDLRITNTPLNNGSQLLSEFRIDRVSQADSGNYSCTVHNRFPVFGNNGARDSTNVQVFFTPVVSFQQPVYRGIAGTNLRIVCDGVAFPASMFVEIVQINGTEMQGTSDTPTGDKMNIELPYIIANISLGLHNTFFACRANNSNGLSPAATTRIEVIDVPGVVDHSAITSQLLSLQSVQLTVPLPVENNAPVQNYTFQVCPEACIDPLEVVRDITEGPGFVFGELQPNAEYMVFVFATNEAGRGSGSVVSFNFSSPSSADATPVMLMDVIQTQTSLIFSWTLPALAQQVDITPPINFTVTFGRDGSGVVDTSVIPYSPDSLQPDSLQGFSQGGLSPGVPYNITVTATYSSPVLVSDSISTVAFTTTEAPDPLVTMPPTAGVNTPAVLSFSWGVPPNAEFLLQYIVSYTVTSRLGNTRRRRQAPVETNFTTGTTNSASIMDPEPYSDYTVNVYGEFQPPGSTEVVRVQVTPETSFLSAQIPPNAPTSIAGEGSSNGRPFTSLDVTWAAPSMPGGPISGCSIRTDPSSGSGPVTSVGDDTSHTLNGVLAGRQYTIFVTCTNGAGVGTEGSGSGMSSVGVQPPTLSLFNINDDRRQITINIAVSTAFGPHNYYQVVVTTNPDFEPNAIASNQLSPHPGMVTNGKQTYVALAGNSGSRSVVIGTGTTVTYRNIAYTDVSLSNDIDYYVFVRLFNNDGDFNDTATILGAYRFPTPLNVGVIIGPIAAVAILLLIVLIALLAFAAWRVFAPNRNRAYSPGGEAGLVDGKRKKRSNAIELRRTRLFSPMLNVGSPDVFTSAGQPTTLICEASGTPAPEVTWTKDGEPLDKERFIQLADASLFINDTDLQDEGSYVVTAVNSAGNTEQLVKVTVLRPVPPEPDEDHPIVRAGDFTEKLALLRANDDEALEDEYADIELDWTFTSYAAKLNINKNKNRYVNIIPYDHSRVVLSLQDNTPGSDYINGSFVDGYNKPNSYIATQGPIPSTFPDFWRMVWELDSPTIIMVTNLKEEEKVKCHQYWPSYGTTTYGNIQVTLKEVENLAEYSIRTFTVTPLAGQSRAQMPVREVRQFHFLVWPDHGVPQYATALLSFRKRVCRYHPEKRGPMVVHCSAGVGRTGTYISIDVILKQIEAEGNLDIFNYVRHMRFRRNYMVQTSSQYVFIHDALLEAIMCGDNSIPAPELRNKLKVLSEVNPDTGKSNFANQFETLKTASPADDEFDCSVAQLPDNAPKNRFKEHLPSNENRVVLESEDDQSDYICASFIDGYRHRHNFIVTQAPLKETEGDFWRMVWEQKSAAIITLTELDEGGEDLCVKYWPNSTEEAGVYGAYQLELSEDEKDKGDYITRRFKLSPVDKPQESRMVTQFHFIRWSKTTPPENAHSILDLIDELQRVQRKSGNGPITVHCDNGLGRTGAFCTLYTVLERVKAEQVVDVFQAVKTLRIQRVGVLETLEEYEFVHKAVLEFLDSFSDYQNFK